MIYNMIGDLTAPYFNHNIQVSIIMFTLGLTINYNNKGKIKAE